MPSYKKNDWLPELSDALKEGITFVAGGLVVSMAVIGKLTRLHIIVRTCKNLRKYVF